MCRQVSGAAVLKKLGIDCEDGSKIVLRKSATKLAYTLYQRAKPESITNRPICSLTKSLELW